MAVRELVSYYVAIEEYYMEHAVGKAVQIREASPGGLTTSLVDDAFFVLQKARSEPEGVSMVEEHGLGYN